MCSIIGYIGARPAGPILVNALRRMEYRGYDSSGVATLDDGGIAVRKGVGTVLQVNERLRLESLPGRAGLGHTRWATHGGVTDANAHPHLSTNGSVAIVHNGIIDNFEELKRELVTLGWTFRSETDSEVIANLLERFLENGDDVMDAMLATVARLEGRYAFVAMFKDGRLAAARYHEPLIVGLAREGVFVGSDVMGFIEHTDKMLYVDNGEMAIASPAEISVVSFDGAPVRHQVVKVAEDAGRAEKGAYRHFTLKEIYEQTSTLPRAGSNSEREIGLAAELLRKARRVCITGSGTSYHAALFGKYILGRWAGLEVEPIISSEAHFAPVPMDPGSVLIALSQSGESADVLEAAGIAEEGGAKVISLVNVMTSTLARTSSVTIGLGCGPEIGVAASKSFTSQMAVLWKLAARLSPGCPSPDPSLVSLAVAEALKAEPQVKRLSREMAGISDVYLIGAGVHYFMCLEGSLKVKELSYIHAEALASGELKHGPLALIDRGSCVVVLNPRDETHSSALTSVHEVKSRGAKVVGISDENSKLYDAWIRLPKVPGTFHPFTEVIPLQLFAYHLSVLRRSNPDYPRNLAKSVTVR